MSRFAKPVAATTAMVIGLIGAWIGAGLGQAQSTVGHPQFEVASIRRHPGADLLVGIRPQPSGRLVVDDSSLVFLMTFAYGVRAYQISGGPEWIRSEGYDIQAKAEGNASGTQMTGPMLQTLLEDRFQLRFHHETKQLPGYELAVA